MDVFRVCLMWNNSSNFHLQILSINNDQIFGIIENKFRLKVKLNLL